MKSLVRFAVAGCVLAAVAVVAVWAQEPEDGEEFQPRLPIFYADVVDEVQKEKIYTIQTKYQEQLAPLRTQLADLLQKQQTEIEAVLTAEQLATIKKKIDESRDARALTRDLTPEQRRAAQEAARRAFLEAVKKAQEEAEKSGETPAPNGEKKEG